MTIVRCPRCRDEVTVPAGASREALVRCPLCLEQYRLAECLASVPPPLVVIADERGGVAGEGSDYAFSSEQPPDRLFDASPGVGAAVSPARPAVKPGARPRRKEKSIVGEMVKVVLGGIVGLSLGLLVLWWGFGRDPVDFAPTVAKYVPWIVPAKLQGKSKTNGHAPTADGPLVGQAETTGATTPATGQGGGLRLGSQFDDALQQGSGATGGRSNGVLQAQLPEAFPEPGPLPTGPFDDGSDLSLAIDSPLETTRPASAEIDVPVPELPQEDTQPRGNEPSLELLPELPGAEAPAPHDAATPRSEAKSGEVQEQQPAERPEMPDLTPLLPDDFPATPPTAEAEAEDHLINGADLSRAAGSARAALARYDELPKDDKQARQQAFTELFLAGSELGRVVSHLSAADPDLAEPLAEARAFLEAISGVGGTSKVSAVKFLAAQHWKQQPEGAGLLVAGAVKDVRSAGGVFEVTLDASVRETSLIIPIMFAQEPGEKAEAGDDIIVLGRVMVDPKTHLAGYEGEAERVLLYGYSVKAP